MLATITYTIATIYVGQPIQYDFPGHKSRYLYYDIL